MTVLTVISTMHPSYGGPAEGIRNTLPELEKMGFQNEVVTSDASQKGFPDTDHFVIHTLGPAWSSWRYNPRLVSWLVKNLPKYNIVVVHGLWRYHNYALWKAMRIVAKREKISAARLPKVFIMPHGMLDPYFQKAKGRWLKAIRNKIYWRLYEYKTIRDSDGLLFTCETELLLARQTFTPYQPKSEFNIGYGIHTPPAYSPDMYTAFMAACPSLNQEPYILFLGRIHEKKGIDLLLKAYNELLSDAALPVTVPKLVIAGPGFDSRYGKQLLQYITQHPGLKDKVCLPGMLSGAAKWGAFYHCDTFILPSHQENFGIAVVEALACNKAVLISNQVNIWREIDSMGCGLVAGNTVEDIVSLLKQWLLLPAEQKRTMQIQAAKCFNHYFSISQATKNLSSAITSEL